MKSGDYLKIGITDNLDKRLKQYRTHNPNIIILDTRDGTYSDEYFLHKMFEKYLINDSEWMLYSEDIIKIFKEIKLNHKDSVCQSHSKSRKKHVRKIINTRKKWKEAKTIRITNNGVRKNYY